MPLPGVRPGLDHPASLGRGEGDRDQGMDENSAPSGVAGTAASGVRANGLRPTLDVLLPCEPFLVCSVETDGRCGRSGAVTTVAEERRRWCEPVTGLLTRVVVTASATDIHAAGPVLEGHRRERESQEWNYLNRNPQGETVRIQQ